MCGSHPPRRSLKDNFERKMTRNCQRKKKGLLGRLSHSFALRGL